MHSLVGVGGERHGSLEGFPKQFVEPFGKGIADLFDAGVGSELCLKERSLELSLSAHGLLSAKLDLLLDSRTEDFLAQSAPSGSPGSSTFSLASF